MHWFVIRLISLVTALGSIVWAQTGSSVTDHAGWLSVTLSNDTAKPLSSLLVVFRQINASGTRALNITFLDNLYNEGQATIPPNGEQVFRCGGEEGVTCEFMGYGVLFADGSADGDPHMSDFLLKRRRSYVKNLAVLLQEVNEGDPDDLGKLKARLEAAVDKGLSYDPELGTKTAPSAEWLGLRDAYQMALKQLAAPGKRNPEQLITDIRNAAKHKMALLEPAVRLKRGEKEPEK
jgi:hypothetical protein